MRMSTCICVCSPGARVCLYACAPPFSLHPCTWRICTALTLCCLAQADIEVVTHVVSDALPTRKTAHRSVPPSQFTDSSRQQNQEYHTIYSKAHTVRSSRRASWSTQQACYAKYAMQKPSLLEDTQYHPSAHTVACSMLATSYTLPLWALDSAATPKHGQPFTPSKPTRELYHVTKPPSLAPSASARPTSMVIACSCPVQMPDVNVGYRG